MKRVMMPLALAGLALLLAVAVVFAQAPQAPEIKVKSKGTATAAGSGAAEATVVSGTLTVTVKGKLAVGPSTVKLTVKGKQGKKTEIKDKKTGKVNGYRYEGFDGTMTVTGEKYKMLLEGTGIKLSANGAGQVAFVGTGTYSAASGKKTKKGKWAPKSTPDYIVTPIPAPFGEIEMPKPPAPAPPRK